jgi:hypothetical protein
MWENNMEAKALLAGRLFVCLIGMLLLSSCQLTKLEPPCHLSWRTANLTHYTSYPKKGSEECVEYNGCQWAGYFAGVEGKQSETWVKEHNIVAVHSKDWSYLKGKRLQLRQGASTIDVIVYDLCSDADCDGCCTANLRGDDFLIDIEKYTMERFGSGSGVVEWREICD